MVQRLAEPTRFKKEGATNAAAQDLAGFLGFLDPTRYIVSFTDFTEGGEALPLTATDKDYTVTRTGTGASAQADGLGGWSVITNSGGGADAFYVRKLGGPFQWQNNKRMAFGARFKVDDALLASFTFGLQPANATPFTIVNGFTFDKAAASAVPVFRAVKASAGVSSNMTAIVTDTFTTLGFRYNGHPVTIAGTVYYPFDLFQDGTKRTTFNIQAANLPVVATLSPLFGVLNGSAVARALTVDWVYAALER